jgi:hypothetical protein
VREHPFVIGGRDVAVMVSGNAMAHLYLELDRTVRPGLEALRGRWMPMVQQLAARTSIDFAVLPVSRGVCEVHGRGHAVVRADGGRISYHRVTGDPLGFGADLDALTATESWEATIDSDYPDALVQLLAISDAPRAGDIILSAAPGWDLRTRWEPIVHASGHGALHREQMLVPLVMSRAPRLKPRRTTDVFPSALAALGLEIPAGLDGASYR